MAQYTILIGKSWGSSPNLVRANSEKYKNILDEIAKQESAEVFTPPESMHETIVIYPEGKLPDENLWHKNDLYLFKFETKKKYCCQNLEIVDAISYLEKTDPKAFTGEGFYIDYYPEDDTTHEYKLLKINFCPFCSKKL